MLLPDGDHAHKWCCEFTGSRLAMKRLHGIGRHGKEEDSNPSGENAIRNLEGD